jgi:hypothetical protein
LVGGAFALGRFLSPDPTPNPPTEPHHSADGDNLRDGLKRLDDRVKANDDKDESKNLDDFVALLSSADLPRLGDLLKRQRARHQKLEQQGSQLRKELEDTKSDSAKALGDHQGGLRKAQEDLRYSREQLRIAAELFRLRKSLLDLVAGDQRSVALERQLPKLRELNQALDDLAARLQQPKASLGRVEEEVESIDRKITSLKAAVETSLPPAENPPKPPAEGDGKKEPEELIKARALVQNYETYTALRMPAEANEAKRQAEALLSKVKGKEYEKKVQELKKRLEAR